MKKFVTFLILGLYLMGLHPFTCCAYAGQEGVTLTITHSHQHEHDGDHHHYVKGEAEEDSGSAHDSGNHSHELFVSACASCYLSVNTLVFLATPSVQTTAFPDKAFDQSFLRLASIFRPPIAA